MLTNDQIDDITTLALAAYTASQGDAQVFAEDLKQILLAQFGEKSNAENTDSELESEVIKAYLKDYLILQ